MIMNYVDLPIENHVQDHFWSKSKTSILQSDGSRHEWERLKYKLDSIVCPQLYSSFVTLIISSKNIKYIIGTKSALLFGNITDPNKFKQNARVT
jgi:hypothetical protein